jgi:hypothetical protein
MTRASAPSAAPHATCRPGWRPKPSLRWTRARRAPSEQASRGDRVHHRARREFRGSPARPRGVVDVCVRYAAALDRRDWELLRSCFIPEATGDYEGWGSLSFCDAFERMCPCALEPLAASQPLLGNFAVTLQGDEANATCYFHAQHAKPGTQGGDMYVVAGTYTDRQVRTTDGWRIAHRRLAVRGSRATRPCWHVPSRIHRKNIDTREDRVFRYQDVVRSSPARVDSSTIELPGGPNAAVSS